MMISLPSLSLPHINAEQIFDDRASSTYMIWYCLAISLVDLEPNAGKRNLIPWRLLPPSPTQIIKLELSFSPSLRWVSPIIINYYYHGKEEEIKWLND